MQYPNRIIKKGDSDKAIVLAIQKQLNLVGCGLIDADGFFGNQTVTAVKLFQIRFSDSQGHPLTVDGEVGGITWTALFRPSAVRAQVAPTPLIQAVLATAISQIGIVEKPLGSNGGPEIDKYLKSVKLGTGYYWCAAFVYWCFEQACTTNNKDNKVIQTAGVIDHWNKAGVNGIPRITQTQALADSSLIKPGSVFIMDFGQGAGHTGIVERVENGKLVTIEGNTSPDTASNNGIGVFRRTNRTIGSIKKGFIDYSTYLN